MKPYRVNNKAFMVEFKLATRLGRARVLLREFTNDIRALWHYGAPFPTFFKLIGTLILVLIAVLPLIYPIFIVVATYFTFECLFLSWLLDQPWLFNHLNIIRRSFTTVSRTFAGRDMWKVREVFKRGILLAHSLATSIDYLCVMQGLLDET